MTAHMPHTSTSPNREAQFQHAPSFRGRITSAPAKLDLPSTDSLKYYGGNNVATRRRRSKPLSSNEVLRRQLNQDASAVHFVPPPSSGRSNEGDTLYTQPVVTARSTADRAVRTHDTAPLNSVLQRSSDSLSDATEPTFCTAFIGDTIFRPLSCFIGGDATDSDVGTHSRLQRHQDNAPLPSPSLPSSPQPLSPPSPPVALELPSGDGSTSAGPRASSVSLWSAPHSPRASSPSSGASSPEVWRRSSMSQKSGSPHAVPTPRTLAVQQLIPHRKPNPKRVRRASAPIAKPSSIDMSQPQPDIANERHSIDERIRASDSWALTPMARMPPRTQLRRRSDSEGADAFRTKLGFRTPRFMRGLRNRKLSRSTSITLDTPRLPLRMMRLTEPRPAIRTLTLNTKVKLKDVYEVKEKIGKGAFGTVRRCIHRASGEECAVKTVKRSRQNGAQGLANGPAGGATSTVNEAQRTSYGSDPNLKRIVNLADGNSPMAADAELPLPSASANASPRASLKSLQKPATAEEIDTALRCEIEILVNMHHPNIVNLYDVFDDPANDQVHMAMQLCSGGELFDRIEAGFSELDAAVLTTQMLLAIEYLHAQKIVHRDLKPENFMFVSPNADADLVLIDFGVSTFFQKEKPLGIPIGTIFYTAPEVFEGEYDERCDVWSIGVILYALLAKGTRPFGHKSTSQAMVYKAIVRKQPRFDLPEFAGVSEEAKTFIRSLLEKDYKKRPRTTNALKDAWFEVQNISTLAAYGDDILIRLARFKQMNDLKKLAHQLIAKDLTKAEIGFLQQQFRLLDTDGDGNITVRELLNAISSLDPSDDADDRKRNDVNTFLGGTLAISAEAEEDVVLDNDEFIAATFRHHVILKEEHIEACYRKFDRRNRGSIAVDDLYEFFDTRQRAQIVFDQVDTNRDGIISLEEFRKLLVDVNSQDSDPCLERHDCCSPKSETDFSNRGSESSAHSARRNKNRLSAHSRIARYASTKLRRTQKRRHGGNSTSTTTSTTGSAGRLTPRKGETTLSLSNKRMRDSRAGGTSSTS